MRHGTLATPLPDGAPAGNRKAYAPPRIEHELEMETRAGSPILFDIDPASGDMANPWDPEYNREYTRK